MSKILEDAQSKRFEDFKKSREWGQLISADAYYIIQALSEMTDVLRAVSPGPPVPDNALTLDSNPLTLSDQILTLG